jgi:hypothetical protein
MERDRTRKAQWTLDVTVFHHPSYGHEIEAATLGKSDGWHPAGSWKWQGLGVPAELLTDIQSRVSSIVTEYLVMRYGCREELPLRWAGDPTEF